MYSFIHIGKKNAKQHIYLFSHIILIQNYFYLKYNIYTYRLLYVTVRSNYPNYRKISI